MLIYLTIDLEVDKVENGISLCIPYSFHIPGGSTKKSLYRVADYDKGRFVLVNSQLLSERNEEFNPKFLKYRPADEDEYYKPVIKSWQAIRKIYDNGDEITTTESFPHTNVKFYEVIINPEYMSPDNESIISLFRTGLVLPEGLSDNFLMVIDQESNYYRTILCRKNYLKFIDGKYYLNGKLEDIQHVCHSLEVYLIEKENVFSTSEFRYFYAENGSLAPVRYFYAHEELPEKDGNLFLYRLEEYLPIYISKYLKTHLKENGLSLNNIQIVVNAIKEAINNHTELDAFFSVTGYQYSEYEGFMHKYKEIIIKHLDGEGFLDDILTKILINCVDLNKRYLAIAKNLWMDQADNDRMQLQERLSEIEMKKEQAENKLAVAENRYGELEEQLQKMRVQHSDITAAISSSLKDMEDQLSEYLVNSSIYKLLSNNGTSKPFPTENMATTISVNYPTESTESEKYIATDLTKARKVLESNLRVIGIANNYSSILSSVFTATKSNFHSLIVDGLYARDVADAFGFSIDGNSATRITISAPNADMNEIRRAIINAPGKVILIENLLDSCNELIYTTINKDFCDKTFIVSFETDECLAMITKSIWTYGFLLNTEIAVTAKPLNQSFKAAVLSPRIELKEKGEDIETYQELIHSLSKIGLPIGASRTFARIIAYLYHECDSGNVSEYIDSVLAKLCQIYDKGKVQEELDEIRVRIPKRIQDIYGF